MGERGGGRECGHARLCLPSMTLTNFACFTPSCEQMLCVRRRERFGSTRAIDACEDSVAIAGGLHTRRRRTPI